MPAIDRALRAARSCVIVHADEASVPDAGVVEGTRLVSDGGDAGRGVRRGRETVYRR